MKNKNWIKIIHIAKAKVNMSDLNYREMLNGLGLTSAKDITSKKQFDKIMEAFQKLGFKFERPRGIKNKYESKAYYYWCELYKKGAVKDKSYKAFKAYQIRMEHNEIGKLKEEDQVHFLEAIKKWYLRVKKEEDKGGNS